MSKVYVVRMEYGFTDNHDDGYAWAGTEILAVFSKREDAGKFIADWDSFQFMEDELSEINRLCYFHGDETVVKDEVVYYTVANRGPRRVEWSNGSGSDTHWVELSYEESELK